MGLDRQGEKLEQLFELARIARGWSRTQLAEALGRDVSRIRPPSGNPKLDLVVKLSRILEWPVGDVVEALYDGESDDLDLIIGHQVDPTLESRMQGLDGEGLYQLATELRRTGRNHEVLLVSQRYRQVASTAEESATAHSFECVAWMTLGRYVQALEAANAGLQIQDAPDWLRENLGVNLANCLYLLWRLPLALGMSSLVVQRLSSAHKLNPAEANHLVAASYVRGNTLRRMMRLEPARRVEYGVEARQDLQRCISLCEEHDHGPHSKARGLICQHALTEVKVELGELSAEDAVVSLMHLFDGCEDSATLDTAVREGLGWAAVFGAGISLRHLKGHVQQRHFAIFSQKAIEIADVTDNWALRERVLTLQCDAHRQLEAEAGEHIPMTLDDDDRAQVISTMARFPQFRPLGWRLLEPNHLSRRW